MTVKKKAHELRMGDKILGDGNIWEVKGMKIGLLGSLFPKITVQDQNNVVREIDTGANPLIQDHIFEVEIP